MFYEIFSNGPVELVMDRVSKNPAKTRHPTILERPEPEPDFHSETRARPNPTVQTRLNPKGFVWIETSNFGPKNLHF